MWLSHTLSHCQGENEACAVETCLREARWLHLHLLQRGLSCWVAAISGHCDIISTQYSA